MPTTTTPNLDRVLDYIRPAVRRQKAYLVATPPGVSVKLNQNESPFGLPDDLQEELLATFRTFETNRYPTDQPWALARALAEHVDWPEDGILVGNGSNELTHTFGLCLIERGTPVVLPRPMFALYESVVRLHDGALTSIPCRPGFGFDTDAIVDAVRREQPALTVLTTPNNPTGLSLTLDAIASVVDAASGFVVVDEAYIEFTEEASARALLDDSPNLILLRTFSKAMGLAGLRVGYLVAHPRVASELLKARLPFMVDRFAEATALAVLRRPGLVRERAAFIKAQCGALQKALGTMSGVEIVPSQANFVLFRTPVEPRELIDRLARRGVLVRSMGSYPELADYVRVNAGTLDENQAFLAALKSALSEPPSR